MSFITKKTIYAGQPGTKKWMKKYGKDLLCVRYKYDTSGKRKIKTVELMVEDESWELDTQRIPANKIVHLKVNYGEINLGKLIKAAGGIWNREDKVWELPYREVVSLGLTDRVVMK